MSPNYIQKSIKLYYLCNKTVINLQLNKMFIKTLKEKKIVDWLSKIIEKFVDRYFEQKAVPKYLSGIKKPYQSKS